MPRNTCDIVVGRLMEIDVAAGYRTVADADEIDAAIASKAAKVPETTRLVIVADWSACTLFTPPVAERVAAMLTTIRPRVERSAILYRAALPTSLLQALRLVRESESPQRRVVTSREEVLAYLDEVLSAAERARLRAFLVNR